ncbi:MAG: chromate transporter [Sheuella sp.]|jgi:chromate transporter|nr:chromate transporter [Sheuella sp.]
MSTAYPIIMQLSDWFELFRQFLYYSIVSISGPLVLIPEMRNFLVNQQHWLTDAQFSASIVLAQAAPGPNILFVALMGWNVGLNTGSVLAALGGGLLCMIGILLPSSLVVFITAGWVQRNSHLIAVRAFKQGMGPVVIALLIASGWTLATADTHAAHDWPLWLVTAITTVLVWRTKIPMLWLLAAGGVLGASGILTLA